MIKDQIDINEVVKLLNELIALDQVAMTALVENRVPCNLLLSDHPTVQVYTRKDSNGYEVGFLGILNGLFGADDHGCGAIFAEFDEDMVTKFFVR